MILRTGGWRSRGRDVKIFQNIQEQNSMMTEFERGARAGKCPSPFSCSHMFTTEYDKPTGPRGNQWFHFGCLDLRCSWTVHVSSKKFNSGSVVRGEIYAGAVSGETTKILCGRDQLTQAQEAQLRNRLGMGWWGAHGEGETRGRRINQNDL